MLPCHLLTMPADERPGQAVGGGARHQLPAREHDAGRGRQDLRHARRQRAHRDLPGPHRPVALRPCSRRRRRCVRKPRRMASSTPACQPQLQHSSAPSRPAGGRRKATPWWPFAGWKPPEHDSTQWLSAGADADAGEGGSEAGGSAADGEGGGKPRRRAAAAAADPAATLEDADALRAKDVDPTFAADPLFHKMSAQFDEGGAKGAAAQPPESRHAWAGSAAGSGPHSARSPRWHWEKQAALRSACAGSSRLMVQALTVCCKMLTALVVASTARHQVLC